MRPGSELNARVRAGFIVKGETLAAWCRSAGYHHQNVRMALLGQWEGPRAREVRAEVLAYLKSEGIDLR